MKTRLLGLVLWAGLFAAPASADLLFHPSVKAPDVYRALYDRAPASVRRVDVTLRIFRDINCDGCSAGYWHAYPDLGPTIGLKQQLQKGAFLHELGHHAWVYAGVDQPAWNALWRRLKGRMPSAYARTNPAEGWAECFRQWQQGKRLQPELRLFLEAQLGTD